MTKPNIIFFMVDQMGAKWLEAGMNGICDLPNLKRLQSTGMTFNTAFSNNRLCCPARAGIATGLTSCGHGLLSNGYRLNPDIPTFMKTLQTAGWRTGTFGKIHFYPFDSEYYPYPDYREYGWDVVHNTEDNRAGEFRGLKFQLEFSTEIDSEYVFAGFCHWVIPFSVFFDYSLGTSGKTARPKSMCQARTPRHPS